MKNFNILIIVTNIFSVLLTILSPTIGNFIQGYFKGQIDSNIENTKQLLELKSIGVFFSETKKFLYISILIILISIIILFIKS